MAPKKRKTKIEKEALVAPADTGQPESAAELTPEISGLISSIKSETFQTMEQELNLSGETGEKLYSAEELKKAFLFLGWDSNQYGYVLHIHPDRETFEKGSQENKLFLTTEDNVAEMLLNKAKALAREGHSHQEIYHELEKFMSEHRHEILELEEESYQDRMAA